MILDVVIRDKNAELPSVCFAWGRDGHRITAFIAAKYLTPQAAAAVKDLLGEQTLADVSTWPDET